MDLNLLTFARTNRLAAGTTNCPVLLEDDMLACWVYETSNFGKVGGWVHAAAGILGFRSNCLKKRKDDYALVK